MRLWLECIPCMLSVRFREIEKLVEDTNRRLEIAKRVVEVLYNELCLGCLCAPIIATKMFRVVKQMTGVDDPYREYKIRSIRIALQLYHEVLRRMLSIDDLRRRVLEVLKMIAIANAIDMGVEGYKPPEPDELVAHAVRSEIYGDVDKAIDLLMKARSVAVVMDNAGECVFDRLLPDVLKDKKFVAVVKGGAFQNDVTVKEIELAELHRSFHEVIDTGSDAASLIVDEVRRDVLDALNRMDLIVSKGMANYEYLTEVLGTVIRRPIVFVLTAKCRPISVELSVPQTKPVVKVWIP